MDATHRIHVSNIPYDAEEEEIRRLFSTAGEIVELKLVPNTDAEFQHKLRGFGFVTYADPDSAALAVRNLNGSKIKGPKDTMTRELRVQFSHNKEDQQSGQSMGQPSRALQSNLQPQQPGSQLPPLPPGVELAPALSCTDEISKTLSTLTAPQLLDILSQMKGLVMGDPARATELLTKAPQFSYAIFQALLLMGLVDTSVLATVIEGNGPPPQAPPQGPPPHSTPGYQQYPPSQPHPQYSGMPGQMHAPTPPAHNNYHPPPMQQPLPQQQPQAPSQEDLIKTVMAMTQQQIDSLPPNERQQIIALRQSLGGRY